MSAALELTAASVELDAASVRTLASEFAARSARTQDEAIACGETCLRRELDRCAARVREALPELEHDISKLVNGQREFLARHADRLDARESAGRIRAGHDVCVELAELALDLTLKGRGDLAERLLSAYAGEANDFELYGVIDFYERQCALARAGSEPVSAAEARRCLLLGLSTQRRPLLPPMLICVGGLVASGKSTIAGLIAERMGAPRIEADRSCRDLSGSEANRVFSPGFEDEVYREVVRRAEIVLASGRPVVIDGCFSRRRQRDTARALAREQGWPFLFVECSVDRETARARLAERDARDAQGGWEQIYAALAAHWEKPRMLGAEEHLVLDCSRPLPESAATLAQRIPGLPEGHSVP